MGGGGGGGLGGGYVSACLWVCVRVMHARWGMSLFCCELMVVDRGCTSVRWRNKSVHHRI